MYSQTFHKRPLYCKLLGYASKYDSLSFEAKEPLACTDKPELFVDIMAEHAAEKLTCHE